MGILTLQSNVVEIDPNVFGSAGYLPGVAKDQTNWGRLFRKLGVTPVANHANTTKEQFTSGMQYLADQARAGDLVVIQHSGHGLQVRDNDGDEADGQDEALCLYDGIFRDDGVFALLSLFRPGVRVLLIIDTCHSGTAYRSFFADRIESQNLSRDVALARVGRESELNCNLLAIGTCSDYETAADTARGGAGSAALLATLDIATDYRDWILRAQKWLRTNGFRQQMRLNEVNADSFVSQSPLSLGDASSNSVATTPQLDSVTLKFADGSTQTHAAR